MSKHKLKYLDLDNIEGGWAELYQAIPDWITELKKPLYEPLDKEVELNYIKLGRKDEVIQANLRFVLNIARHYIVQRVDVEDLVFSGNHGLIEAYDTFDPSKGTKFISWAVYLIREKMMECIREHQAIKLSKKAKKLLSDYAFYGSIYDMKEAHPERYWQVEEKLYEKLDNYLQLDWMPHIEDEFTMVH